jgi:hypothetical protein
MHDATIKNSDIHIYVVGKSEEKKSNWRVMTSRKESIKMYVKGMKLCIRMKSNIQCWASASTVRKYRGS